ncbi:hypothetical protein VM57_08935 [Stenotrophomonas maltophilia]|uniref:Uncharacterized protein n=1 Tax=Stenotrophomonas maltophilia TaxID=40324 RepID=A0A0F5ZNU1_STEMA|nr:hypothetical protein VM57_08935 [Stenotrophomonas maltophilia]
MAQRIRASGARWQPNSGWNSPKVHGCRWKAGAVYALASPVTLDIGSVLVRDVSFAVLGKDDLPRIGLDVLRALGRVRINQNALVIQAAASPVPCARRMATLSSLWGDAYDVRYPIRAGKQNVLVKVDTGFNGGFQARGTLPARPPAAAIRRKNVITTEGSEDIQYVEATTPVMIGDEVLNLPMDIGLSPGPRPLFNPEWRLGFASTQRYSLYMDVAGTYGCPVAVAEHRRCCHRSQLPRRPPATDRRWTNRQFAKIAGSSLVRLLSASRSSRAPVERPAAPSAAPNQKR